MRKTTTVIFIFAVVLGLGMAQATAQRGACCKGMPNYDPATEITVKGTVTEVIEHKGRRGWTGMHLMLKAEQEILEVHLGPKFFLEENQVSFAAGDEIEVIGSKVKYGKGQAFLPRQIKKDNETLSLRDKQGIPNWSRSRRR